MLDSYSERHTGHVLSFKFASGPRASHPFTKCPAPFHTHIQLRRQPPCQHSPLLCGTRPLPPCATVTLDACSFNVLIKGLCAKAELNAAFRVLEEFSGLGCGANARTHATLMKGLCDRGRLKGIFALLERMEGGSVDTDVAVFNVLIGGLRKGRRVDEGWWVLEGMMEKGVCPNGGSYNEVLCGLVEGGRFEKAKKRAVVGEVEWVLRDMVRKGFVPKMGMWGKIVQCALEREGSSGCVAVAIDGVLELDK
ncbi:hypothetical protein VNO80_08672 [Phaseolus coccineus]|uniref:Pentatricopeptide repeat-containing protein n=1 Tax=Phaseolus coccineus TaxID=3886 RepID=A0AAN9N5F8_PHACN